jgi:hypothetical protein
MVKGGAVPVSITPALMAIMKYYFIYGSSSFRVG